MNSFFNIFVIALVFQFTTSLLLLNNVRAEENLNLTNNIILTAKNLNYDKKNNKIIAEGNVEIIYGKKILFANKIIYLPSSDIIIATDNVSLLEEDGTVYFADYLKLSDQMKNGIIKSFKALLANDSRFAAKSAHRIQGNKTVMENALYSSCKICEDNPYKKPLWQIRANEIIHNQEKKLVTYKGVKLEMKGIPVLYTPYFSHPDSSVKRKTGFLVPTQGRSTQLGTTINIPVFFTITPNIDTTIETKVTSKEGIVLGGELRHKTKNGFYILDGSITNPEERDDNNDLTGKRAIRSHLFSSGNFEWNETWKWGFSSELTSDDTYLRKYKINDSDILKNNFYVEGFSGQNYASGNVYFFQGLRAVDDPGETPLILPLLDHNYVSYPDNSGIIFKLNSNFLNLTRKEGADNTRLSFRGGWHLPSRSELGDILTLSAEFKIDTYLTNDLDSGQSQNSSNNNEFQSRIVPQFSGEWRWPLIKENKKSRQLLEPIINFAVSPYGGNPGAIPNEDSQSFEFDDTNVFSANRFPGLDRIEGGPRVNFGFKYGIYGNNGGTINLLLGQVFRLKADDTFAERTGLEEKKSDYVGKLSLFPRQNFKYYQRFRLDKDTLSIRRNEISFDLGTKKNNISLTYLSLSRELTAEELIDREEIAASIRAILSKYWSITGYTRHDLTSEGGTINSGTGFEYSDECFSFIFDFERNFTRDRDLQPNTSATFRIRLKNL